MRHHIHESAIWKKNPRLEDKHWQEPTMNKHDLANLGWYGRNVLEEIRCGWEHKLGPSSKLTAGLEIGLHLSKRLLPSWPRAKYQNLHEETPIIGLRHQLFSRLYFEHSYSTTTAPTTGQFCYNRTWFSTTFYRLAILS